MRKCVFGTSDQFETNMVVRSQKIAKFLWNLRFKKVVISMRQKQGEHKLQTLLL